MKDKIKANYRDRRVYEDRQRSPQKKVASLDLLSNNYRLNFEVKMGKPQGYRAFLLLTRTLGSPTHHIRSLH